MNFSISPLFLLAFLHPWEILTRKYKKVGLSKKQLAATEDSVFTVPVYQKGGQITLLCNPQGHRQCDSSFFTK